MPPKSKYHRTEGQALPPISALQFKGNLSDLAQGIIFGMVYAGRQQSEVAKVCGTDPSTISRTVAAVAVRLDVAVNDKPSPDKPRAEPSSDPCQTPSRPSRDVGDNSPGELAVAKEMTRKRTNGEYAHQNSRDIRTALHNLHGISYSVRHVQRLVHEAGGRWVRRPTTCPLTAERMTKRVAACTRLLKQLEERPDLKNKIVFSDESMLRAEDTRFMCLQRPGEKAEPRRKARWAPQVHVWGPSAWAFGSSFSSKAERLMPRFIRK